MKSCFSWNNNWISKGKSVKFSWANTNSKTKTVYETSYFIALKWRRKGTSLYEEFFLPCHCSWPSPAALQWRKAHVSPSGAAFPMWARNSLCSSRVTLPSLPSCNHSSPGRAHQGRVEPNKQALCPAAPRAPTPTSHTTFHWISKVMSGTRKLFFWLGLFVGLVYSPGAEVSMR